MRRFPISDILPWIKVAPNEIDAILGAERFSLEKLARLRGALISLPMATNAAMTSFALGSLGRLEAGEQSDLDLAFLYDSRSIECSDAEAFRRRIVETLRAHSDIPEKTFRNAIDIRELARNVGGSRDSNINLTYRALLLTEGRWLHNSPAAESFRSMIFSVYASGVVSRGRFLNSLGNDLHRYYRTLCVDYRFKVEEQDKAWAMRIMKLRHARKLWHLANIALQCWFVDQWRKQGRDIYSAEVSSNDAQDHSLAGWLSEPPLVRISMAMRHFGEAELCRPVFLAYNYFLDAMDSQAVRDELGVLAHDARYQSPIYVALRENAEAFDSACAAVIERLWRHSSEYLVRFCIL
jgi:hypothetical protein